MPVSENAGCHFQYNRSGVSRGVEGTFNSPRHPANYPHDIRCLYDFNGFAGDHIRIVFESFKVTNISRSVAGDHIRIVFESFKVTNISRSVDSKLLSFQSGHYAISVLMDTVLTVDMWVDLVVLLVTSPDVMVSCIWLAAAALII